MDARFPRPVSSASNRFLVPPAGASRSVPATPPAGVLGEVDAAAARADALWREDRELHFACDPTSGGVVVQVRDREGRVIRTIAPSEALGVMSGRPL